MENKPRKPWIAVVLTFLSIGLGQLYYGEFKKGVFLFFIGQLLVVIACSSFLLSSILVHIIALLFVFGYLIFCVITSLKEAKLHKDSYALKKINRWYVYLLYWFIATFVIGSIVETTVKNNITQSYRIPTGAMIKTILIGDHISSNKFVYKFSEPNRGDIVIFPFPDDPAKDYIKRIVAVGGDTIEIKDKKVLLNGNVLHEPYVMHQDKRILPKDFQPRDNFDLIKVPDDSVFVMGDNRDNSYDSRFWGFVKKSSIKGKAIHIYFSWDSSNSEVRWDRIGKKLK